MDINNKQIDDLLTQIEIERRRKLADYENGQNFKYIDPNRNVERVKIYNNNIIEARRGCGKTSLILKALEDNSDITIKCDCQGIRSKSPEDIVLYLLEKIICEIEAYTKNYIQLLEKEYQCDVHGVNGIFKKIFYKKIKEKKKKIKKFKGYYSYLKSLETRVKKITEMPAEQEIVTSVSKKKNTDKHKTLKKSYSINAQSEVGMENSFDFLSWQAIFHLKMNYYTVMKSLNALSHLGQVIVHL